ncbi:DnaD domain protein [Lactobacillus sp. ESL0679]|uniref:DnaD domain protein n=1 Tax=Lactobacillus sp. ESL0679 TaxID=2983209 RepID=UPI0023F81595|nr:DnaD domain protein [Lactobacillus sp. ESL0679]MDF7683079.1 DnaD domain protein [Lactobacillus sp. ESL0679]
MFETSNPKQPFFIINRVTVFPQDLQVLIKLYQPLVGASGVALYLTLMADYDAAAILSDSKGIYHLQEQLDCSLKELFQALHKLEAVGLVKTRIIKNEIMGQVLLFSLNRVPGSSEFFATALLASLLKEKVGVTTFQRLSHAFAQENKRSENQVNGMQTAKDVSASFMDVFRLPDEEAISPSPDVQQAAQENQVKQAATASVNEQDQIDWQFMKEQFEIYQIAASEIDKNRPAIRGIMRTYGLSEQEFVDETLPCLHDSYQLDMPLIKRTIAENIHAEGTRKNLQQAQDPQATIQDNSSLSLRDQRILQVAQTKSPAQFLYRLKTDKHDYVDASEYKVLDNLYNQKDIPAELLNILTYACLNSGPSVSYRLANTILHDWLQHGVKTGSQALEYMEKRQQKKSYYPRYSTKPKRVEKGTDWSKKTATQNTDVSSADLKKFFKDLEDKNGMK